MSERAPTTTAALDQERAKLESDRLALQKREQELEREVLFGKYDDAKPAEGEVSYQQYLEQRPADGIIRDGETYRNAQTGTFANAEAYDAQQKADTRLDILENQGEYEAPKYEDMSRMELVREMARAQELGDKAAVDQIKAAVEELYAMEIVNEGDDSETPEAAQDRYFEELQRFDKLVAQYGARRAAKEGPAGGVTDQLVQEINDGQAPGGEVAADESAEATAETSAVSPTELGQVKRTSVTESIRNLASKISERGKAKVGDDAVEGSATPEGDATVEGGEELEGEEGTEAAGAAEQAEASEEKLSRVERAKKWFKDRGESLRKYGGTAYWAAKWEMAKVDGKDKILNRGVTEAMSDNEKERIRRRNRIAVIAGASALAVGAAVALGVAIGEMAGGQDAAMGAGDLVNSTPDVAATIEPTSLPSAEVSPDINTDVLWPSETEINEAAFDIPKGQGGEALFENAGLEPAEWYQHENTLLEKFPDDFYRMPDGHVGIARPGMLSEGAQTFISSLRG